MFIRSERLFLRPGWPEDWQEMLVLIGDEAVARGLSEIPWPFGERGPAWLEGMNADLRFPHFFVTLPDSGSGQIIGSCGIAPVEGQAELGYWIARQHWGKGYASEAVRAVLRLAPALGHRQIVSGHFADNPASARLLEKCGFTPNGAVKQRLSPGRGEAAPCTFHAIDLPSRSAMAGGDDPEDGEMVA